MNPHECETCGADDASKCVCPYCGEHACDCPDPAFEDEADEQLRLWTEYNQTRGGK